MEKIKKVLKKRWYLIALLIIFLLSLHIRFFTLDGDWLLAYDPYFHYRYTGYVVENGIMPAWDSMSYYPPGRPINHPPVMHYTTAYLYMIFGSGMSLMLFCKYMAGIYGALATIPAFFLGKEFSDKKAGLLAAFFIGTSVAVLTRTMAGFYDTDGLVVFFTLLTMYLLVRSFKKKSLINHILAFLGLVLFGLTWGQGWYIPIIVMISSFAYFITLVFIGKKEWRTGSEKNKVMPEMGERAKKSFKIFKKTFFPLLLIFIASSVLVWLMGYNPYSIITALVGFTFNPAQVQIVNISVAELQNLNILGGAWSRLFSELSIPFIFSITGVILLLKRDLKDGIILLTWLGVTFFAITRGVRFMLVFAPAAAVSGGIAISEAYKSLKEMGNMAPLIGFLFLASVLVSFTQPSGGILLAIFTALMIVLYPYYKKEKEKTPKISKAIIMGVAVFVCLVTLSQATQVATQQSERNPINNNWKEAYFFLRDNTPEDSVVGTWWDPGHRIAAISERRNIADGAHCPERTCDPGLNTRITHLGKIFNTDNETEAAKILLNYKGDASEIYWIASDDLIGKFRWLQYFGTGCDGTGILTNNGQQICPLYTQMPLSEQRETKLLYRGGLVLDFSNNTITPKIEAEDGEVVIEKMLIYQQNGSVAQVSFENLNNTIPGTVWIHPQFGYTVYIPTNHENSLFTRMFFKEEEDTEYFERVFMNEQVKIYRLKIEKAIENI